MGPLKKLKEEDGSTIVEASLVMPLVLLSMIAIVLTIVFLVESLFVESNVHSYLKYKAGVISNTRIVRSVESYQEQTGRRNMVKIVAVDLNHYMKGGYLLPQRLKTKVAADSYVINEKKIIRYKDFFDQSIY